MDFDKVLEKCGNFNRYQFMLLGLFGFVNLMVSMHYFSQTIISFAPDHWCYHEKLENLTFEEIKAIYKPFPNPSCTKLSDIVDGRGIAVKEKCDRWIYDYEFGYRSMTTELNWVCESAFKSTLGQSLFFVGSVVGTLVYGILSDRIGRLPTIIISNLSGVIGDFGTSFTSTVPTFAFCRFISGLAADTNYYLMYIMVLEYLRPSMRTFGLNLCAGIFYCSGLVLAPWLAVLVGNWKYYLASAALPLVAVIAFYFVIPESAQWLVTRRKFKGAIKCLRRVAKFNGKEVDESVFKEFEEYYMKQVSNTPKKKSSFIGMFRTPRLRKLTFILLLKSMVITLGYDVVSRNVEGMGLSPFIMFTISSIAVLPSSITMILLQDKIGRKAMAAGSLLVGGIFTTATGVIIAYQRESQNALLLAIMLFIARYGVSISYESGAQYAAELIPTCVRGQGVAIVHVAGYAISFLSAYIIYLSHYFKPLPSMILSILLLIGSFSCLLLPETLNRRLPQTLEEGEMFGKGEKMLDFPCLHKENDKEAEAEEIGGERGGFELIPVRDISEMLELHEDDFAEPDLQLKILPDLNEIDSDEDIQVSRTAPEKDCLKKTF